MTFWEGKTVETVKILEVIRVGGGERGKVEHRGFLGQHKYSTILH